MKVEIRAADSTYFKELIEKVLNCARAASSAAGAKLTYDRFEPMCDSWKTNKVLLEQFVAHVYELGMSTQSERAVGSTDMEMLAK